MNREREERKEGGREEGTEGGGAGQSGRRERGMEEKRTGRQAGRGSWGLSIYELVSFSAQPGVLCKNKPSGVRIFQMLGDDGSCLWNKMFSVSTQDELSTEGEETTIFLGFLFQRNTRVNLAWELTSGYSSLFWSDKI